MGLNKSKGNMYDWITHTWNTVKGKCYHSCSYCSIKSIAKRFNSPQKDVRFDEKELKTNLGKDNFIFVGSSNDMFADNINEDWIVETLHHCRQYPENKYLFQTKNPENLYSWRNSLPENSVICSTIESNRFYPDAMANSPKIKDRIDGLNCLYRYGFDIYITIEPIMDFDLVPFIEMLKKTGAKQINIGADSSKIADRNLIEPTKDKLLQLISELEKFTVVKQKSNLARLLV